MFIDPSAKVHEDAIIETHAIIGPNVVIGAGTHVHSFAVIRENTTLGKNNVVYSGVVLGGDPQDRGYSDADGDTWLEVGDNNVFREQVTINRGSHKESGKTVIGHHNYFMTYSHVGHDCVVGDHNIFVNCSALGGHVVLGNRITLSAYCAIHQFCRVGDFAFIADASQCKKDVLPFTMITTSDKPHVCGLNTVGLQRNGFDKKTIRQLKRAYNKLFSQGLLLKEAVTELHKMTTDCPPVQTLIAGIARAKRGFIR